MIYSCQMGPELSAEQIIPEHFFMYLLKGSMEAFNGSEEYYLSSGDYCIARKNHLVRYKKHQHEGAFEKIVIILDEPFLKGFAERYSFKGIRTDDKDSILNIKEDTVLKSYIKSLEPYYKGESQIEGAFANIKREELLMILLNNDPTLANMFFDFGIPGKIDLKEFMYRNFRFNISLEKFAFLSGRSLSTFKREFKAVFGATPGQWLTKKRLDEAYFLIRNQKQKPATLYQELGFEDLSHFSFAFKKEFGQTPGELLRE